MKIAAISIADYVEATEQLPHDAERLFFRMLLKMYSRQSALPDDDRENARMFGYDIRRYRRLKHNLLRWSHLLYVDDGLLKNPRVEHAVADVKARKQSAANARRQQAQHSPNRPAIPATPAANRHPLGQRPPLDSRPIAAAHCPDINQRSTTDRPHFDGSSIRVRHDFDGSSARLRPHFARISPPAPNKTNDLARPSPSPSPSPKESKKVETFEYEDPSFSARGISSLDPRTHTHTHVGAHTPPDAHTCTNAYARASRGA